MLQPLRNLYLNTVLVKLASLHKCHCHLHVKVLLQNNSIIICILIVSTGRAYQRLGTVTGHAGERKVT